MPSLRFLQPGLNLKAPLPSIDVAQIFIAFSVLLFSLTVHEAAHAWAADRLGDVTARRQGRLSLNPLVHADPIGTVLFPLLALMAHVPLIGWAKPVPVRTSALGRPRRDYMLVAAAGPASNLALAIASAIVLAVMPVAPVRLGEPNISAPLAALLSRAVQLNLMLTIFNLLPIPPLDGGSVLAGLLPRGLASRFEPFRPYGMLLLYVIVATDAFSYVVLPPYNLLRSWLP
jgi:Zn-dependent protease